MKFGMMFISKGSCCMIIDVHISDLDSVHSCSMGSINQRRKLTRSTDIILFKKIILQGYK
jgi:hypothetical protein